MFAHARLSSSAGRLLLLPAVLALVAACAAPASAQVSPTGAISGSVADASGAVVAGATVTIRNAETNAEYNAQTSENGTFAVPSLPLGLYTAAVKAPGFKQTVVTNIKVEAGKNANVSMALEVGAVSETVTVESGAEVLQTTNTAITSTVTQRQVIDLPFATRDAMQIVLVQPGTSTPGTPRASSINGLPKGSLNITLDGINVQDNLLKSSDGFFTSTQLKADAISELSVTTGTQGADSSAGGAILVAGRTKSGTNQIHGGGFWQHRNTALNANYYFNNVDGLPRDRILLNQFGGNVGGPIWKDHLFFFHNYEEFRLPQTYNASRQVLTEDARNGIYTYRDSAGTVRSVNLYALAAAGAGTGSNLRTYPSTPDPTVASLLNAFAAGTRLGGTLRSRVANASDYNRFDYNFQTPGRNVRRFPTTRFDWHITPNHQLEFVHHYQQYVSNPDAVNGQLPVVPGAGIVLGSSEPVTGSIIRNVFSGALALRSTLSPTLVNEVRGTLGNGGISIFGQEATPGLYSHTRGAALDFPFISDPFTRSTQSRRHTPTYTLYDNVTWTRGSHSTTMGGSFTYIKSYQDSIGRQAIPLVAFGIAASDPVNTGATSIFTTTNFPNSTAAQRTDAGSLYALLTGRVSSISRSASYNPDSERFEFTSFTEQNRHKELGLYGQDQWRVSPTLTLNLGLRWELDFAPRNVNGIYTTAGYESVWGVSGEGNLFRPGVFRDRQVPQFRLVTPEDKPYETRYTDFAPSFGVAWSPDLGSLGGVPRALFGKGGQTVLRGGYSIAFVREGFNTFHLMWGSNEGPTVTLNVTPGTNPAEFGAPGSVLFRDPTLPSRPLPSGDRFPITAGPGASFNEWDPDLRMGYVQSWSFGLQRELTKNMALEVRYVANHGTKLWRQLELNEVNIFENGFLDEFRIAQENLRLARAANPASNNFGPQNNVAGTRPIPIISTALGTTNDAAFATTVLRGEAGRLASNIAFNTTRMNNLMNANLVPFTTLSDGSRVSNFFIVNPLATAGSFLVVGDGHSTYNAMQVEFRRRISRGLLFDGSYTWSKSLSNMFGNSSVVFAQPTTMRDPGYDKGPSPYDLRHGFKVNAIWELPVGPGRRWLDTKVPVLGKLLEGWQLSGVGRVQSGTPLQLTSGRLPFNGSSSLTRVDGGVVLRNITTAQLQELVEVRKTPSGVVYWLPDSIIQNTLAAFETGGRTLADLDPKAPYIGPPTTAGELGARVYLYGPWQKRIDLNVLKRTRITERVNFEFRAQFLNAFNYQNFFIGGLDSVNSPILSGGGIGSQFGQTRSAYRDVTVSGTNDPGGRLIEFQLRLNF
ncbi:MAG TPA: carboxypeptidase-like regulatory domain-containing protein [Pyrinomonadaceae bacterium]